MSTQQTAKTQYVETHGIRLAYRHFGKSTEVPLVFMQHFRGTMDHWDPALINPIAEQRSVLLLDNAGVGKSTGEIPITFAGWAANVINLLNALHIPQADLLGFSMGGMAAQMVALNAPQLIRKLILGGTAPSANPAKVSGDVGIFMEVASAVSLDEAKASIANSFYYPTDAGRKAAAESWARIHERQEDRSDFLQGEGIQRQIAAVQQWSAPDPTNSFDRLHELKMPVLIANGDKDALAPTPNSFTLYERIPDASLVIYPRTGHGFLDQYAAEFAARINEFLDEDAEPVVIPGNGFQGLA